jgi:hypothetical protein
MNSQLVSIALVAQEMRQNAKVEVWRQTLAKVRTFFEENPGFDPTL